MARQLQLFPEKPDLSHGGELAHGRRKGRRPFARRRPIHFVLKSGKMILPSSRLIEKEIQRLAQRFGLRIYRIAIARDHVHFLARLPGRREYVAFIRSLTGILARKLGRGLWKLLPFSRVANWGREFRGLVAYLQKNTEEALGLRPYEPRQGKSRKKAAPG
jgi:REP element-mobilizing transposase RayT